MGLVCPHCQNSIELVEGPPAEEILCAVCGSSFRLERGATTDWSARDERRTLGKYELIEPVGVGAFGTVYKARDPDLDRVVAVKVPRAGTLASRTELDRFVREARSVAQLRHPFLVSVFEVGQAAEVPYLVSEFVEGVTLADQLSARRPAPREAAELVARLADALHYAHEMGVVHRDVKPANVMLSGDGTPRLMDFGLAKRDAGDVTVTIAGQVLGTPAYMSPEQARGEAHQVDGRSDVYSLGVILYQLITGELPFRGTPRMLLNQVLHDDPRRPRSLSDRIPKDLETICLKAMAKEPARRYQTARELADDLRRFLKGEPILARPLSTWERGVNWVKRRPAVTALLVVSGVAVVALGVVITAVAYNAQLKGALQKTEEAKEKAEQAKEQAEAATKQAEAATKVAERNKYFLHIALAHAGWREGNLVGAEKLLDDCPSDQRNWEWHYLKRVCHAHSMVFTGKDSVLGLAFSPDGQRLACGCWDGTVRILDAATRKKLHAIPGHTHEIADVAFSPDGKRLASSYFDGAIKVWEVATGREIKAFTCPGHKKVTWKVTFSPDGTRLASASMDQTVRLWDARTGQAIGPVFRHPEAVWGVAFSSDGSQIVSGCEDKFARLWEVATGGLVRIFERSTGGAYSPVAFSPDGHHLASADGDGTVKLWDASTGLLEHHFNGHRGFVWSVTFSPNGHWLASSGIDQTVRVWDVTSGQQLQTLNGHTAEVNRVAFHPDGSWLASTSGDGTLRAWPVTAGQEARLLQSRGGGVGGLAYSRDGARLASTARDQTVTIWDAETGQLMHTFTYQLLGPPSPPALLAQLPPVAYSPDGCHLAAGAPDGSVPVWDTHSDQLLQQPRLHSGAVSALAYSPDGSRLASAGEDATVLVCEAATGQVVHKLTGHTDQVTALAFSPDGSQLASSSLDMTVKIWDTTTGRALDTLRGHTSWVVGIAFSRDGTRLASAGNDNCAIVWELATRRQVRIAHASLVWRAIFSPDGKRLVSSSDDGTIKVWELATGIEILALRGHTTGVTCLSFSPDGTRLASGSYVGAIRIWDARPWTPEASIEAPLEREALGLLDYLFTKPLRKADVLDYLHNATGITSLVREKALTLVERYREETDPERYHQASWAVVRQPYLNAFQYRFALQQAKAACDMAPRQGKYLTTLGAAQYRARDYEKALETLTKAVQLHRSTAASLSLPPTLHLPALTAPVQADQLRQAIVANLAFRAMTEHHLGQKEQARATLARLREVVLQAQWNKDEESRHLLREAEALMGSEGSKETKK